MRRPGPAASVPFLAAAAWLVLAIAGVSLVRFGLPQEARVTIEVLDPAGRRVRTLCDATFPAGAHTVGWEGSAGAGERACRVRTAAVRAGARLP